MCSFLTLNKHISLVKNKQKIKIKIDTTIQALSTCFQKTQLAGLNLLCLYNKMFYFYKIIDKKLLTFLMNNYRIYM